MEDGFRDTPSDENERRRARGIEGIKLLPATTPEDDTKRQPAHAIKIPITLWRMLPTHRGHPSIDSFSFVIDHGGCFKFQNLPRAATHTYNL